VTVSCPKCGTATHRAFYPLWVILVSICFFPFGLLSLLAGRKPSQCPSCGFTWQT
jgi:Uncharacterized conserved protein (DUF2367)